MTRARVVLPTTQVENLSCQTIYIFPLLTPDIFSVINNDEGQKFFTFDDGPTGQTIRGDKNGKINRSGTRGRVCSRDCG